MKSANPIRNWNAAEWLQQHVNLVMIVLLALVNGVLYLPTLTAYFISDDFAYVSMLHFRIQALLSGQKWDEWLIASIYGNMYFRPAGHLLFFVDYLMWGLAPFGYHVTNVVLHVLASFQVFLLTWLLVRERTMAAVTAFLFAVLPIHSGAVSWVSARYDVLSALFYFASLIFFVLALRKNGTRFYLLSLGSFALALSSKETAITLPLAILLYDALFHLQRTQVGDLVKRQFSFWLALAGYIVLRVEWLNILGFGRSQSVLENGWAWVDGNLVFLTTPLFSDMTVATRWIIIGVAILLLLLYRSRREVGFALVWIPVTLIATLTTGPSDRSFYISSFGLSLTLVSILVQPVAHRGIASGQHWWISRLNTGLLSKLRGAHRLCRVPWTKLTRTAGFTVLLLLAVGYSTALFLRNQDFHRAGEVAEAIPQQVKSLHPTLPPDARLIFVGVLDRTPEGPLVYLTGFPGLLHTKYEDPTFQTFKFAKFPIWFDRLDRTFFFQVDHRRVTERADLVRALEERKRCEGFSRPALLWNFSQDAQGWEPWNQLSDFEIRDGALIMRSLGNDSYMASPPLDIPTLAIGEIEITMRVGANQPALEGALYWLTSGQQDFSPDLQESFVVQADGEWYTYQVNIAQSGKLLIGDRIVQLRLDPVDGVAKIEIKTIRVFEHCTSLRGERCECAQ